MEQPILQTTRLMLRPFTMADAPAVKRLAGAPEVADTTLSLPHPYPDGAAEEWIGTHAEQFASGTGATFAMVDRGTIEVCGAIALDITPRFRRAEMGYWLGVPYWNRGYTTEAAAAILKYGFETLNLHRIFAQHFTRNPASGRVMQKIGMIFEGILREHLLKDGRFEDVAVYGILQREWRAQQAGKWQ